MKTLTQKIITGSILLGILIAPTLSFAEQGNQNRFNGKPNRANGDFCTMIEKRNTEFTNHFNERLLKLQTKRNDHALQTTTNRSKRDEKRTEHQTKKEEKKDNRFEKLDELATTAEQKAAVVQFKATVQSAIAVRQTAISGAVTTFRAGIDAIREERKDTVDDLIKALQTAKTAAFQKAKSDCASGVSSETAQATFEASIKAAHDTFTTGRKEIDKKPDITALQETRKTAIQKALDEFKKTVEEAKTKLQSALQ